MVLSMTPTNNTESSHNYDVSKNATKLADGKNTTVTGNGTKDNPNDSQ